MRVLPNPDLRLGETGGAFSDRTSIRSWLDATLSVMGPFRVRLSYRNHPCLHALCPSKTEKKLRERVARSESGVNQVRWWAALVSEAERKHRKILRELLLCRVTSVASGHPSIGSIWIDVFNNILGVPACRIYLYIP